MQIKDKKKTHLSICIWWFTFFFLHIYIMDKFLICNDLYVMCCLNFSKFICIFELYLLIDLLFFYSMGKFDKIWISWVLDVEIHLNVMGLKNHKRRKWDIKSREKQSYHFYTSSFRWRIEGWISQRSFCFVAKFEMTT